MDGQIDYASYTTPQLKEAFADIDRERFPLNFSNLQRELEKRSLAPPSEKPQPVTTTREPPRAALKLPVRLLWASIIVSPLLMAMDWEFMASQTPASGMVVTAILVALLMGWLTYKLARGRNWSRITLLVLFIAGAPFYLIALVQLFMRAPGVGALSLVQALMQYVALYIVFTDPARTEFRRAPKQ